MKHLLLIAILSPLTSLAASGRPSVPVLNCYGNTPQFSLVVNNTNLFVPVDTLRISQHDRELIAGLLEGQESGLNITGASLNLAFPAKSCELDAVGSRVAHCRFKNESGAMSFNALGFTYLGKSPAGTDQRVEVSRPVMVETVDLDVNVIEHPSFTGRTETRLRAELTLTATVAGALRTVKVSKLLGEWNDKTDRSNWDRCLIEKYQGI